MVNLFSGVSEGGEVAQQVTTLKTNVIGLGNYINSVNRNFMIIHILVLNKMSYLSNRPARNKKGLSQKFHEPILFIFLCG